MLRELSLCLDAMARMVAVRVMAGVVVCWWVHSERWKIPGSSQDDGGPGRGRKLGGKCARSPGEGMLHLHAAYFWYEAWDAFSDAEGKLSCGEQLTVPSLTAFSEHLH